ncbi:FAD-binding oxidoreductase [Thioclava sp. BHET1]|nr:FAD-binding oxidoreductase [Thioclava sp. BHET1]
MPDDVALSIAELLGASGWIAGHESQGYARDWLDRYGVPPLGVARPASTEEVAALVRLCAARGVPVIPQGGNTGLCGGAVDDSGRCVIVSLERLNQIKDPEPGSDSVEVGAGVVLAALHDALVDDRRIFPMHLGAEGSAHIGGLIGTNAGGSHAFRFGMMRDLVLGLEVVLPDGTVWDGMRAVQKDNAGYGLRSLFCGAEGTLGIVTRAVLRTWPAPAAQTTALLAVPDLNALMKVSSLIRGQAADLLTGFEFFCDAGLELALQHVHGIEVPLDTRAPWYVLAELSALSERVPLDAILEGLLEECLEAETVVDGTIAMSMTQRAALWRLREEQPEGQRLAGPQLKHDISVPPARLPAFMTDAAEVVESIAPNTLINPFGHLGDGNVHYNLSPCPDADIDAIRPELEIELARLATRLGGSCAAEHGLGRSKIALAETVRSDTERALMARLKSCMDPAGVMNPGVIVRA